MGSQVIKLGNSGTEETKQLKGIFQLTAFSYAVTQPIQTHLLDQNHHARRAAFPRT